MNNRIPLIAPKGMVYTNGTIYGYQIHLAVNLDKSSFYLITEEEYEKIKQQEDLTQEEEK